MSDGAGRTSCGRIPSALAQLPQREQDDRRRESDERPLALAPRPARARVATVVTVDASTEVVTMRRRYAAVLCPNSIRLDLSRRDL